MYNDHRGPRDMSPRQISAQQLYDATYWLEALGLSGEALANLVDNSDEVEQAVRQCCHLTERQGTISMGTGTETMAHRLCMSALDKAMQPYVQSR